MSGTVVDLPSLKPHERTEPIEGRGRQARPAPERPVPERPTMEVGMGEDRYRLVETLGRGGMGEVLKARDTRLRREVAVKRILSEEDAEALARFTAEARIGGQLDHPAVLPVYDLGHSEDGTPFFTMKLVPGHRTLADVMVALRAGDAATVADFSFQRRVALMQQVCRAITYAHRRGVIHRDLKPANLVVGADGEVYVVDWGIAKLLDDATGNVDVEQSVKATLAACDEAALVGTPAYMAPEVIGEGICDERTDTWSLCVILYELLTLEHPLGVRKLPELLDAYAKLPPKPAERFRDPAYGRVPRALSQIAQRGLAADRADRYAGPAELERALQAWLEGASPIVCPGTLMQRMLGRAAYHIDQHPVALPMAVIGVLSLGLALAAGAVADLIWRIADAL